jgi:hypothetical protein
MKQCNGTALIHCITAKSDAEAFRDSFGVRPVAKMRCSIVYQTEFRLHVKVQHGSQTLLLSMRDSATSAMRG